ncbi:MAG: phosphatidylglycerophosphatase A [Planctomycetes bacterium]|nr:phosphatidylglycerophosphatase A [Planctomycetota bacterium]MCB9909634.1 phosphatidylglycerophosphatase A [Planctomycetota bacterium]MCB9911877.1 phosphatidylglycerophosphatase A [Planctomycetota bacterium]HPF12696.1 phosphatidylglycerophosphatase A [Planctomycetota bacterium]HRV80135.1 phosphatidylglycerophosphatase A [Planctomycetota bacterium]
MQPKALRDWRVWLVTCLGLGMAPVAPGTFGTLGGVAIAWALIGVQHYLAWLGVIALAVYLLGRALTPPIEAVHGKDPGFFVLDEVVGYLVTIAWWIPPSPLALGMGFVVFRFFDILKPPPIRRVEHLGGGDGIMLDDVVAGIYGFGVMCCLRYAFPGTDVNLWAWKPGT